MGGVTEADIAAAIGGIDEIIMREVVRTQASPREIRKALELVRTPADLTAAEALPPRMRRLVDLLSVAVPEPVGPRQPRRGAPRAGGLPSRRLAG